MYYMNHNRDRFVIREAATPVEVRMYARRYTPLRATPAASGLDLYADFDNFGEQAVLAPGSRMTIPTGVHVAMPSGFEGQVRPRSGLAAKQGITILNTPGTIDADYRGELKIILYNSGVEPFKIVDGDRIAQLVIVPIVLGDPEFVKSIEALGTTERGEGGFGSTGVR